MYFFFDLLFQTTRLTESSWLLLLADLSDAISTVEELLRRPVSSLSPNFLLFEMEGRDFQLNLLPANRLPSYLPSTRVLNLRFPVESNIPDFTSEHQVSGVVGADSQISSLPQLLTPQPLRQLPIGLPLETTSPLVDFTNY